MPPDVIYACLPALAIIAIVTAVVSIASTAAQYAQQQRQYKLGRATAKLQRDTLRTALVREQDLSKRVAAQKALQAKIEGEQQYGHLQASSLNTINVENQAARITGANLDNIDLDFNRARENYRQGWMRNEASYAGKIASLTKPSKLGLALSITGIALGAGSKVAAAGGPTAGGGGDIFAANNSAGGPTGDFSNIA